MLLIELNNAQAEFEFLEMWNGCEWKIHDDYPKSIFMIKDKKCLFEQNHKNVVLYCSYSLVWSVFESRFGLNHNEIRELIAGLLLQDNKMNVLTPNIQYFTLIISLLQDNKMNVLTPHPRR